MIHTNQGVIIVDIYTKSQTVKKMGIEMPPCTEMSEILIVGQGAKEKFELVSLNNIEDYCKGEYGNTTLLVEHNRVKSLPFVDSGASLEI